VTPLVAISAGRRWVVERTRLWLMNNRQLRIDHQHNPAVTEGFVWVPYLRRLLCRLTEPASWRFHWVKFCHRLQVSQRDSRLCSFTTVAVQQ